MRVAGWLLVAILASTGPHSGCPVPDLIILVDQSGSMTRDFDRPGLRWAFTNEILSGMRFLPGRASIFVFGESVQPLVRDMPFSEFSIPKPPELGWSDLMGAIRELLAEYPETACGAWIIVTDGVPQTRDTPDASKHKSGLQQALRQARDRGIPIIVVLVAPPEAWRWGQFQEMRSFWIAQEEDGFRVLLISGEQDLPIIAQRALGILRGWWTNMMATPTATPSPTPTATPAVIPTPVPIAAAPAASKAEGKPFAFGGLTLPGLLLGVMGIGIGIFGILAWRRRKDRLRGVLVWRRQGRERRVDLSRYRGEVKLADLVQDLPPKTATIKFRREPSGEARIYLVPMEPGRVRYRGEPIREPVPLRDGDHFEVDGTAFEFQDLRERSRRLQWGSMR